MVLKPGARGNIFQGEQKWVWDWAPGCHTSELPPQAEEEQWGVKKDAPCPQGPEHPLHTEIPNAQRKEGLGDGGSEWVTPRYAFGYVDCSELKATLAVGSKETSAPPFIT